MSKTALSIFCLISSTTAFADTFDIVASNNQIGIQSISTNIDYTETLNGGGTLDTETGTIPGLAISISAMMGPGNIYIQAEYDHSSGDTVYTGAPLNGGVFGSIISTSSATLADYSARFGKGYSVNDQFMLTPFAEIGHHQWDRGVNYGETYTHNYMGIGALGQYSPVSKLVLSANVMVGETFGSYITANSGPSLSAFSGPLGDSTLYKLGVSADYAFREHFHGNIAIDYTRFTYRMSAVYPGVYNGAPVLLMEPDSKTNYTTIRFGLGYAF